MSIYKLGGMAFPLDEAFKWASRVRGRPITQLVTVAGIIDEVTEHLGLDFTVVQNPLKEEKDLYILIITHKRSEEKTDDYVDYRRHPYDDEVEGYLGEQKVNGLQFMTVFLWMDDRET